MSTTEKRVVICYALAVIMLFICVLRVFAIINDPKYFEATWSTSSRTVTLNYSRGSIFDTNNQRLTNGKNVTYAVIFGQPETIAVLYKYFTGPQIESITEEIRSQGFALRTVSEKIEAKGIYCFSAFSHADDSLLAKHIIGYTDSQGFGVCGIEAAFDGQLSGKEKNTITFTLDGHGNVLSGEEPRISYDYEKENSGVRLTLDADIQQIVEQEAMVIDVGAVIVSEVKTGKIRALVSRPDYRLTDISSALAREDQPLLNRALCTYNIGSVFKPFVAAAGYEAGVTATVNCVGYTDVDGLTFTCHNLGGHGETDTTSALKYSCNSYFYSYIQSVTAERVAALARRAGFEGNVYLAKGIVGRAGSLGNIETTALSKRALCNFSIGQGELMLSPLAITNLYVAIANSGCYRPPSLVEGLTKNGKFIRKESLPAEIRVMSPATADRLRSDLAGVLTEGGTGEKAMPTLTTAAGKTGTAQTGVIKNGKKVTNSWFCGFFPLEAPKYAVTVLAENASGGVGGVFASIADEITKQEQNNGY